MPASTTSEAASGAARSSLTLLDTHIAVWLADANRRLKPVVLSALEAAFNHGRLCLSPISAWEIGLLVAQDKLDLGQPPLTWFDGFTQRFNVTILDITPEVAVNSSYIPGKFHRDPADRILVATAMIHSAVIVTADKNILDYAKQGFVKVIAT